MEKRGLGAALAQAQVGEAVYFVDELRVGLQGQVRVRWGVRGARLVQQVERVYAWRYLVLAVNPLSGELRWAWVARLSGAALAAVVAAWRVAGVGGLVWDGAAAHRASVVRAVGVPTVQLPAYSPELNPVERVFREVRRWVEGVVYEGSIEAKMAAVEAYLQELASDPGRVRRLVGWGWVVEALANAQVGKHGV